MTGYVFTLHCYCVILEFLWQILLVQVEWALYVDLFDLQGVVLNGVWRCALKYMNIN